VKLDSSIQVKEWLINWFVAREKIDKSTPQPPDSLSNADYFAAGWLTSMEVVEFVTEIEEHFGMQFTDRDLQDSRFVTIGGLTELILAHSTRACGNG
jgi:acyl carrier protein